MADAWVIDDAGRAKAPTAGLITIATLDCGQADCTLTVTLRLDSTTSSVVRGLVFRLNNSADYWIAGIQPSSNKFGIFQATLERASTPITDQLGVDYAIQVVLNGSQITATLDGANEVSYSSSTNATKTLHGLGGKSGTLYDNFQCTF
jgi:hypothetical protein